MRTARRKLESLACGRGEATIARSVPGLTTSGHHDARWRRMRDPIAVDAAHRRMDLQRVRCRKWSTAAARAQTAAALPRTEDGRRWTDAGGPCDSITLLHISSTW